MKVKIETAKAAALFSCAVGDHRDLQRHDARSLIDSGDVSDAEPKARARKPAPKRKASTKNPTRASK